ncbi:MAG: formylglycine-generating enzyme family protein [Calditrichaeota bacterium]|nr:formylglycine-generating enzyme family protein [Calditrichota bacterium]
MLIVLVFLLNSCNVTSLFIKSDSKKDDPQNDLRMTHPQIEGMAYIPGGWFNMGSKKRKNEKPVRRVYIEGLYMDKTEVTVAQYRKFAKATKRKVPKQPDWNLDDHPVVNVAWKDAMAYAKWVGKRLPTEAEWEYVARGGSANYQFVYQNSQQYGKNYENIADESMRRYKYHFPVVSGYDDGYVFTSPVGLFAPNKFGIHDLNGNVLEWCADWYSDKNPKVEQKNPVGPAKGNYKVIRGASWNRSGKYMSASYRTFYNVSVRFDFLGFRCAKDAEMPITQK